MKNLKIIMSAVMLMAAVETMPMMQRLRLLVSPSQNLIRVKTGYKSANGKWQTKKVSADYVKPQEIENHYLTGKPFSVNSYEVAKKQTFTPITRNHFNRFINHEMIKVTGLTALISSLFLGIAYENEKAKIIAEAKQK